MRSPTVFHPLLFVAALLAWSVVGAQGLVVMNLTLQQMSKVAGSFSSRIPRARSLGPRKNG
ncbi:hypothetical protein ACN28S_14705 [Cystobacter fuscus]